MNHTAFVFLGVLFFCPFKPISAQQVTGSAGGNATGSGGSFSYTVGEPVSDNISGIGGVINEGVQQSENIQLRAKIVLSGPFDLTTGLMKDSLRSNHLIPLTEPYSSFPYMKAVITESAGETVSNVLMNENSQNALVDWLFIEIRSASNSSTILATKRALMQRDGDVVSHIDGVSAIQFDRVPAGNYYVSIKHRNHLGVMTAAPVFLSNQNSTLLDFTTMQTVYTTASVVNTPRKIEGGKYTLWSGDVNSNKNIKYNGISNDKDIILTGLGGPSFVNTIINGVYRAEDLNLDGKIRYNNTDNDRSIILSNIGLLSPNTLLSQHTPN